MEGQYRSLPHPVRSSRYAANNRAFCHTCLAPQGASAAEMAAAKPTAVAAALEFVRSAELFQFDLLDNPALRALASDAQHAPLFQLLTIFLSGTVKVWAGIVVQGWWVFVWRVWMCGWGVERAPGCPAFPPRPPQLPRWASHLLPCPSPPPPPPPPNPHPTAAPQDFRQFAAAQPGVFEALGVPQEAALAKMRLLALMGLAHGAAEVSFERIQVRWRGHVELLHTIWFTLWVFVCWGWRTARRRSPFSTSSPDCAPSKPIV